MNDWTFNRDAIRVFRFVRCDFDAQTGIAQLAYAFDDGPELVETVVVPGAPFELDAARAAAAERALRGKQLRVFPDIDTAVRARMHAGRVPGSGLDEPLVRLLVERGVRKVEGGHAWRSEQRRTWCA